MPKQGARARPGLTVRTPALLPRSFYLDSPDIVARKLLGKLLVRPAASPSGGWLRDGEPPGRGHDLVGRIVEVEAYFGGIDPAAHTFAGKTPRNAVLFGPPGHAYVYFIYGMHSCLNVSCEPEGQAGGLLIRALEPVAGLEEMASRRGLKKGRRIPAAMANNLSFLRALASGPGRLCQAFAITRARDNGVDFTSPASSLQIQDDGFVAGEILVTPRIGIRKAPDTLARFLLAGNPYVSGSIRSS
jgi:DNA-3-methyladenine glycosylase